MQKPAAVTGIAYIQFLSIWSMFKTYDTPLVGRSPLYLGSWLPPHLQWAYHGIEVLVTIIATVGLILGRNGSRWLLLLGALVGWIAAAPVRNMQGIPLYLTSLLVGTIVLGLLFLAPSARAYFSLPRTEKAPISLRRFVAAVFYAICALNVYSFSLFDFVRHSPLWLSLTLSLALSLPCLLLGMVARWNVAVACRDSATVMIATALFLTFQFLAKTLSIYTVSPESLALVNFKEALSVTSIAAVIGLALARMSIRSSPHARLRGKTETAAQRVKDAASGA
jgi:hypothetical protein